MHVGREHGIKGAHLYEIINTKSLWVRKIPRPIKQTGKVTSTGVRCSKL